MPDDFAWPLAMLAALWSVLGCVIAVYIDRRKPLPAEVRAQRIEERLEQLGDVVVELTQDLERTQHTASSADARCVTLDGALAAVAEKVGHLELGHIRPVKAR